jgi:hypothetical protein
MAAIELVRRVPEARLPDPGPPCCEMKSTARPVPQARRRFALVLVRARTRGQPFLVPSDRPAPARQDDEAGLVDTPLDQAGGDDVGDNLLELVALDARARVYGADAPSRRGIASADVMQRRHDFGRQRETVRREHHLN